MATCTTSASSSDPREIVNVSASVSVAFWPVSCTILDSPPNPCYSARASAVWGNCRRGSKDEGRSTSPSTRCAARFGSRGGGVHEPGGLAGRGGSAGGRLCRLLRLQQRVAAGLGRVVRARSGGAGAVAEAGRRGG